MKELFLTALRDKNTSMPEFRKAAHAISKLLALEAANLLPLQSTLIQTPLGKTSGSSMPYRVVLTTILRSGLAFLPAFEEIFPDAPIGFFGIRRDEMTAAPKLYYENIPQISKKDWILLIDPMLATGGSSGLALSKLKDLGATMKQTILITVVSSQFGIKAVQQKFPEIKLVTAAIDPELNDRKFIVPGLGDFGDRYFGTTGK